MTNDTTTTETVTMSTEAAQSITNELRAMGKTLAATRTKFASLVKRAKEEQAHTALGFDSWTEYVATVFSDVKGLAKADVEYLTVFMAGEGMSSRSIARALGVSQSTAARQIRKAEEAGEVDADREVEDKNGKSQTAKGKGKGRAKGKTAKTDESGESGDSPKRLPAVKTAKTEELRATALSILAELSDRWAEGDEAAEAAMLELADAAIVTV